MTDYENEWFWKMDYCKKNGLPPAQEWAWNIADKEWKKYLNKQKRKIGREVMHKFGMLGSG